MHVEISIYIHFVELSDNMYNGPCQILSKPIVASVGTLRAKIIRHVANVEHTVLLVFVETRQVEVHCTQSR